MLKLTIKPGEYIDIGKDIRVVYSGGTEGNIHLLIDAPREMNIVRSKVLARTSAGTNKQASRFISEYYAEPSLSQDTLAKIHDLIREEKKTKAAGVANLNANETASGTGNTQLTHGKTAYYKP